MLFGLDHLNFCHLILFWISGFVLRNCKDPISDAKPNISVQARRAWFLKKNRMELSY